MCLMPSCNSESADSGWANHSATSGDVSKLPWWGIPVSSHFETNPFRGDCIPFNRCNIVWWGCSWGPYERQMDSVSLLAFLVVVGCYVLRTTSPMRWFKDIYGSWPVSALKMVRPRTLLHTYNRHDHHHHHHHRHHNHHHLHEGSKFATPSEQYVSWGNNINFIFMRDQNSPPPMSNMLVGVKTSTLSSWWIKFRQLLWTICWLAQ